MSDNPDRNVARVRSLQPGLATSLGASTETGRFSKAPAERLSDREGRLLRGLLQSLDFPMYVIDANTCEVVLANASMCRNGPPWGMTCYALTHHRASPCEGKDGPCPLERVRRTKRPVVVEHRHYGADGNVRYFEIHAVPILDDEGCVSEMIEYNIDVTERRRATEDLRMRERALELLIRQLELSNEELAAFASVAAHDIRSPLQSISASAAALELILGKQADHDARRALDIIGRGVDRLNQMISALYRCSRASKGVLHVVDVDLNRLMREVCSFHLAGDIETSGAQIHVAEPLNDVRGDELQILELLQNLISNALKFRREKVAPEIHVRTLGLADGRVRIEVEDNGVGIPNSEQRRVFDMFARLDEESAAGLGIGLAFCKRVAQRHGGHIGVRSTYGSGSTFWVELPSPCRPPPAGAIGEAPFVPADS
jgi:signal transduction histidine kinase